MGISDDIKPKKIYRFETAKTTPKIHKTVEQELPEENSKEALINSNPLSPSEKDKLEDDFFRPELNNSHSDYPITDTKKPFRSPTKVVTTFLIIIIICIVSIKNFRRVYNYFYPEPTTPVKDENLVDYYVNSASSGRTGTVSTGQSSTITPSVSTGTIAATTGNVSLKILNGNGIRGSAESISALLKSNNYTVEKVGNAKTFSYAKTYIYYSNGMETEASKIRALLSNRECILQQSDSLTTGYDLVVVVGKK